MSRRLIAFSATIVAAATVYVTAVHDKQYWQKREDREALISAVKDTTSNTIDSVAQGTVAVGEKLKTVTNQATQGIAAVAEKSQVVKEGVVEKSKVLREHKETIREKVEQGKQGLKTIHQNGKEIIDELKK